MAKSFAQQVDGYADKVKQAANLALRDTSLDTLGAVIASTPVDTGRARQNWSLDVGQADLAILDNGSKFASSKTVALQANWGDVLVLSNNLPYIRRLEFDGWSGQAPAGMLRINMSDFQSNLQDAFEFYMK